MAGKDGYRWEVDSAQYHADGTAVSRSMFMDFVEDPELYYGRWVEKDPVYAKRESKIEYDIGNAFESMVQAGGPGKVRMIPKDVLGKGDIKAGAAWEQFRKEHSDQILLKEREFNGVLRMCNSMMRHDLARKLLLAMDAKAQYAIRWSDERYGFDRKALLDYLLPDDVILDLKSTKSVNRRSIYRSIEEFGYDYQSVWYQDAVERHLGHELPFVFIFVQKTPPFSCRVVQLDEEYTDYIENLMHCQLLALGECYRSNKWHKQGETIYVPKPKWSRE